MHWTPTPLNAVTTSDVWYFDSEQAEVCRRICQTLSIDCFPDLWEKAYWKLQHNDWVKEKVTYDLDAAGVTDAFDERVFALLLANPAQPLFRFQGRLAVGVIHFSDYQNEAVYTSLYQNLNQFEVALRKYILFQKPEPALAVRFLQKRLANARSHLRSRWEYLLRMLHGSTDLGGFFDRLTLNEIMAFAGHPEQPELLKAPLAFLEERIDHGDQRKTLLNGLRNRIMHHKTLYGLDPDQDPEFVQFTGLFHEVLNFRYLFSQLATLMLEVKAWRLESINAHKLQMTRTMSDQELRSFFFGSGQGNYLA